MKKLIFTLLIVFYITLNYFAQVSGSLSLIATPNSKPDWIYFKNPALIDPSTIFLSYGAYMGLGGDDSMVLLKQETDNLGITHTRYNQYYKNLKVEGRQFIIHSRNSKSYLANGNICKNLNINPNATISSSLAITQALSYVNAVTYMWQDPMEEQALKQKTNNINATYYPSPELLLTLNGAGVAYTPANYRLAYKVEIHSKMPSNIEVLYIDANTGGLIKIDSVRFSCVPTTGTTMYSGIQTIPSNFVTNPASGNLEYKLENPCKGGGIITKNGNQDVFSTTPWSSNITMQQLLQMHWASDKYYDFLLNTFNRQSIDNNNMPLESRLTSNGPEYVSGVLNIPLQSGTNDIIGHEWGHGITANESGAGNLNLATSEYLAIHEGMSDVLGASFEFYLDGVNADWTIGEDNPNIGLYLRDLSDPLSRNMPNTYLGLNYAGSGEHGQGQILGHWYYLLTNGGTGTNSSPSNTNQIPYNVTGIGMSKALKIFYRAYSYLNFDDQYINIRRYTIQAAIDIYGDECSLEVSQVKAAWDAVGVYDDSEQCGSLKACITKNITSCNPQVTASANITASGGSGSYSYAWFESNGNLLNFSTPNATNLGPGSYYCIVGDDILGCFVYTSVIIVESLSAPFTITVSSNKNPICLGECVTITASGASNYTFNNISNATNTYEDCPTESTIYTVKGTNYDGCTFDIKTINIIVNQPISVSVTTPYLCPGQSVVVSASGANTYAISPSGFSTGTNPFTITPPSSQIFNITGTDNAGCVTSKAIDLKVDPIFCCNQGNAFIATSGNVVGGVYNLNSTLTLTNDLNLLNVTIFMGINAEIIVPNNLKLSLSRVHMLGCPSMWKGIKCSGISGSVLILNSTLIEDAITAIDLKNVATPKTGQPYILSINGSTFNKNLTSVNIENYNATTNYPSSIVSSAFTSRKLITNDHTIYLGSGPTTYNWNVVNANNVLRNSGYNPTTPVVMSLGIGVNVTDQFSASTFPSSNLSFPYQNNIGRNGILLNNVANNNSSTIFNGFVIGNTGNNYSTLNLFDNLNIGINALNSNVSCYNAAFQNMTQYLTDGGLFGLSFYTGGAGIKTETNSKTVVNKLNVLPSSGNSFNKSSNFFFNNSYGILATNLQYSDIQYAMIHSNRVYVPNIVSSLSVPQGAYGIYILTNSYPSIKADNNYLTNVNTGISFYSNGVSLEQAYGSVSISSNYLQSDYTGNPTNRSMGQAIVADNLFNCKECIANDDPYSISVNSNQIKNVFRGIKSSNWRVKICYAAGNTITLSQEPNGINNSLTTQYGILHENNYRDIINSNNVTGFGITKATTYAIRVRDNTAQTMLCNSTASTYEGFSFSGSQNIVKWQKNTMQSHVRGMHLNNTTIGQQGAVGQPMDNVWQIQGNGWSGTNYQTYVTTSNIATNAINSKLFVRNIATLYRPTNNDGSPQLQRYLQPTSIITTSGSSPIQCPTIFKPAGNPPGFVIANIITSELKRALNQIVKDSVIYNQFIPNKKIIGKQAAYNFMKQDQSILVNEVDLQNFFNQTATGNVNTLLNVEDNLSKSNIVQAVSSNNTISPANNIEINAKYFYALFIKYTTGALTPTDKLDLFNLANGCPDRDGSVVYQARVLYNSMNNIYRHFEDSCGTVASNNRMGSANEINDPTITELYNVLQIFPNPNSGKSLINFTDANITNMQLKVYDVNGRVVFEDKVNDVTDKFYELNLDVKNGIYFVEVFDTNTEVRFKQKLVIQK